MPNLVIFNYYYRYRQERQLIKTDLVDIGNYQEAKINLENTIAEHESRFPDSGITRLDFNYGEKLIMNHALDHLNGVIRKNDPQFIDENGNIKHQSDIVKSALVDVPDQNN